jgi:hypothetical protein
MEWPVEGKRIGWQSGHVKLADRTCRILVLIPKTLQHLWRELRPAVLVSISLLNKVAIRFPHPPSLAAMARHT